MFSLLLLLSLVLLTVTGYCIYLQKTLNDLARCRRLPGRENPLFRYTQIIADCSGELAQKQDLDATVNQMLKQLRETTGASRSYVFRYSDDRKSAQCQYAALATPDAPPPSETAFLPEPLMRRWISRIIGERSIALENCAELPSEESELAQELHRQGIRSLLHYEIRLKNHSWGFIGIDYLANHRKFSAFDTHLLQNVANLFSLGLERHRQFNLIADSVNIQQQIFENVAIPLVLFDMEQNIIAINPYACKTMGKSREELLGQKCHNVLCGHNTPPDWCPMQQSIQAKRPVEIEFSGHGRHYIVTTQPILDRQGNPIYILESAVDISALHEQTTELERSHQELLAINRQLQDNQECDTVINNCLKILLLSTGVDSSLDKIIELVGRKIKAELCAVYRQSPDGETLQRLSEWPQRRDLDISRPTAIDVRKYPACQQLLQEGKTLLLFRDEAHSDPKIAAETAGRLDQLGLNSLICVGIIHRGRYWGHIGASPLQQEFPQHIEKIMQSTARIIDILLEREETLRSLARTEQQNELIWNSMTVPMLLFDPQGHVIRANPALESICGQKETELISTEPSSALPDETLVSRTVRDHRNHQRAITYRGRDYLVTSHPILDGSRLSNVLESFIDVTEINQSRKRLQEALAAADSAAQAKSNFLATMSHEIRTPLNAVIGFSELLQNGGISTQEQAEYLRSINLAGNALLQLINDILDLSKLEAGKMTIPTAKDDLGELCREMIAIFSLRARQKDLELEYHSPAPLPLLEISVPRMRQVLLNLIGNAIKFTPQGKIVLYSSFEPTDHKRGTLTLQVADTGVGISDEYKKRIFNPFVQEENVRDAREGTGLGLAISQRLIEHMGGKMTVESVQSVGSCFTIKLYNIHYEYPVEELPFPASEPPSPSPRSRKVLLVDDVPLNLQVLRAMLKHTAGEIRTASSGEEALHILDEYHPDLILTDLWMPYMNGAELAAEIRRRPDGKDMVLVAVTADTETDGKFQMNLFQCVLLKPVSRTKLEHLFRALDNHEYTRNQPLAI